MSPKFKSMQILHAITKTASGYTLKVWETAETTKDRVRPFLWEINLEAATTDEFKVVLEQIDLLHQCKSEKLEQVQRSVPLSNEDMTLPRLKS